MIIETIVTLSVLKTAGIVGASVAAGLGSGGVGVWLYLRHRLRLTQPEQAAAGRMRDHADNPVLGEIGDYTEPIQGPVLEGQKREVRVIDYERGTFIGAVVRAAKVKFGVPEDILANRMCVRKFVSDMMEDRGMRPTHISEHIDMVVELVFLPNARELESARMRHSVAFMERRAKYKYTPPSWDYIGWWKNSAYVLPLTE